MKEPTYVGPFDGTRPNSQPIEKLIKSEILNVHSIFHTMQGEGPFCGQPAVFVRLAGCNLMCPRCDTTYLGGLGAMKILDVANRIKQAKGPKTDLVVITGGEPLRQPQALTLLCKLLVEQAYSVQIETNGTLPIPKEIESLTSSNIVHRPPFGAIYVVCSPKTSHLQPSILSHACCLKYVGSAHTIDPNHGLPVEALGNKVSGALALPPKGWDRPVYLQPEDCQDEERNKLNMQAVVSSCMEHGYTLQIQTHKYLGVE